MHKFRSFGTTAALVVLIIALIIGSEAGINLRKMPRYLREALVLACFVLLLNAIAINSETSCPVSSKMQSCTPTCKDDTECFGQQCCPNICNTKSCTQANQRSGANTGYKGSNSGATGSYCGNVKCNSFEKCDLDKSTKRMKCVRA